MDEIKLPRETVQAARDALWRGYKGACADCHRYDDEPHAADCLVGRLDAALAVPAEVQGWRAIETAPRDGTHLLLWDGFSVFEGTWNGHWCNAGLQSRPWVAAWQPLPATPAGPERKMKERPVCAVCGKGFPELDATGDANNNPVHAKCLKVTQSSPSVAIPPAAGVGETKPRVDLLALAEDIAANVQIPQKWAIKTADELVAAEAERVELRARALAAEHRAAEMERENERLRKVLKPFADIPLHQDSEPRGADYIMAVDMQLAPFHVRAARAALTTEPGHGA